MISLPNLCPGQSWGPKRCESSVLDMEGEPADVVAVEYAPATFPLRFQVDPNDRPCVRLTGEAVDALWKDILNYYEDHEWRNPSNDYEKRERIEDYFILRGFGFVGPELSDVVEFLGGREVARNLDGCWAECIEGVTYQRSNIHITYGGTCPWCPKLTPYSTCRWHYTCDACHRLSEYCACYSCVTCNANEPGLTGAQAICAVCGQGNASLCGCCACPACSLCEETVSASRYCTSCARCSLCCTSHAKLVNHLGGQKYKPFVWHGKGQPVFWPSYGPRRYVGIEWEVASATAPKVLAEFAETWEMQIMEESSIPKGAELCSQPARGLAFRKLMRDWETTADKAGADCTEQCGLHVHVDARDYTYADIVRLLALWALIEPWMFGRIEAFRRTTKYAVPIASKLGDIRRLALLPDLTWGAARCVLAQYLGEPVKPGDVRRPKKTKNGVNPGFFVSEEEETHDIRWRAVNILAWAWHGTVEFRLAPGTVNMRVVEDWACLLSAFVDLGRDRHRVRQLIEAANPAPVCAELHQRSGLDPARTEGMEYRWRGEG